MRTIGVVLLAIALVVGPLAVIASYFPPPLIFIIAGQSNASGRGQLSQLPSGFPHNGSRITNFTNSWQFEPATEPLDLTTRDPITGQWDQLDGVSRDNTTGVGFGLAFADRLADSLPNRIVLLQCSKGASTVQQWLPERFLRRDRLFGSCLWRTLFVIAQTKGVLAGLLWYQGESNAIDPILAGSYLQDTQQVFDAFRTNLGAPDMPILLVRLHPQPSGANAVYWQDIRSYQDSMARSCSQFVVGADGVLQDTVHLSTPAQIALGELMADRYLMFLKECT